MRISISSAYIAAILAAGTVPIGSDSIFAAEINPPFTPTTVAPSTDLKSDAINHLREFTLATSEETVLGGKAAMLMGLVETNQSVPTEQVSVALTDEIRFFTVSIVPDSDDIILTVKRDAAVRKMYLTNSKFLLRAAIVHEDGTPRLVPNEQAAAGFESLLMFWIEKSKSLQAGHTGHVH